MIYHCLWTCTKFFDDFIPVMAYTLVLIFKCCCVVQWLCVGFTLLNLFIASDMYSFFLVLLMIFMNQTCNYIKGGE